jgi:hypothetical protein
VIQSFSHSFIHIFENVFEPMIQEHFLFLHFTNQPVINMNFYKKLLCILVAGSTLMPQLQATQQAEKSSCSADRHAHPLPVERFGAQLRTDV